MLNRIRRLWHTATGVLSRRAPLKKERPTVAPPLGATARDRSVALTKGAVGMIPIGGSIFAEIIGQIIPEQRAQRLETYVRYLDRKLSELSEDEARSRMSDPENIALFEEGAFQSARAISDERRERIAKLVILGITGEQKDKLEAKRLLGLFGLIDDDQVIILASHLQKHVRDQAFRNANSEILNVPRPHINSSNEDREKYLVSSLAKNELIRLKLLEPQFEQVKDISAIDPSTGMAKVRNYALSGLGRMLLRRLQVAEANDL
jgi:hypothetical protein